MKPYQKTLCNSIFISELWRLFKFVSTLFNFFEIGDIFGNESIPFIYVFKLCNHDFTSNTLRDTELRSRTFQFDRSTLYMTICKNWPWLEIIYCSLKKKEISKQITHPQFEFLSSYAVHPFYSHRIDSKPIYAWHACTRTQTHLSWVWIFHNCSCHMNGMTTTTFIATKSSEAFLLFKRLLCKVCYQKENDIEYFAFFRQCFTQFYLRQFAYVFCILFWQ